MLQPTFRRFHVRQAVLFGSYAKGNMSENSDIDLVVDSGLVGLDFVELLGAVANVLNKDVDPGSRNKKQASQYSHRTDLIPAF